MNTQGSLLNPDQFAKHHMVHNWQTNTLHQFTVCHWCLKEIKLTAAAPSFKKLLLKVSRNFQLPNAA